MAEETYTLPGKEPDASVIALESDDGYTVERVPGYGGWWFTRYPDGVTWSTPDFEGWKWGRHARLGVVSFTVKNRVTPQERQDG